MLARYNVSTPSGIMTINAVPMSTPMPIVEMSFNRDCERESVSGRDPARKDLAQMSVNGSLVERMGGDSTQWP